MSSKAAHSCTQCDYTTERSFNLKRHIQTRHTSNLHNLSRELHNSSPNLQNSSPNLQNSSPTYHCDGKSVPTCLKCNRTFSRNSCLTIHIETCDGTPKGCCNKCKKFFPTRNTLFKHRSSCQGIHPEESTPSTMITHNTINNTIINNTNITNITNNNTTINNVTCNILVFPKDDMSRSNFDFITEHISQNVIKRIERMRPVRVGFQNFMVRVFERPENRIVKKTNPNVCYSEIHVGNNKWELAHDDDVFPNITYLMTTAALERFDQFHIQQDSNSRKYICEVNEEDDESKKYKQAIQTTKYISINVSRDFDE